MYIKCVKCHLTMQFSNIPVPYLDLPTILTRRDRNQPQILELLLLSATHMLFNGIHSCPSVPHLHRLSEEACGVPVCCENTTIAALAQEKEIESVGCHLKLSWLLFLSLNRKTCSRRSSKTTRLLAITNRSDSAARRIKNGVEIVLKELFSHGEMSGVETI